jgi:hypothetical protein
MKRPDYQDVATAIARANSPEERERAGLLLGAYYGTEPHPQTTRQRMTILKNALLAALAEEQPD